MKKKYQEFIAVPGEPFSPELLKAYAAINKQAVDESLSPVRPGVPGKLPFWNRCSIRFIYAPAFDFPAVDATAIYRFTATSAADGNEYVFEATEPWRSLAPIWKELPVGYVFLTIEVLDIEKRTVISVAGTRRFYKAAPFAGPYNEHIMDYQKSARLVMQKITSEKSCITSWIDNGTPDAEFWGNVYPVKAFGLLVTGLVNYLNFDPPPDNAPQILTAAKNAANHLITLHMSPDTPLAHFPPTYHGVNKRAHLDNNHHMLIYPAEAANAYLKLFEVTKHAPYLEAAKQIADTYKRLQLPNGTWYLMLHAKTGEVIPSHARMLIPFDVVELMDNLINLYGREEYRTVRNRAMQWIMDNPLKTLDWSAQYEDSVAGSEYQNLSAEYACRMVLYLLEHVEEDDGYLETATTLSRFIEDQFIVWERPMKITGGKIGEDRGEPFYDKHWFTPCAWEQLQWLQPVLLSSLNAVSLYQKLFEVTGKDIYLGKAVQLADTILVAQQLYQGDYPTYVTRVERDYWVNVTLSAVQKMYEFGEFIMGKQ